MTTFRTIDGREMVPPEPLELTIEALDQLPPGQHVMLLLHHSPRPLFNYLRRNGYRWSEEFRDDGTCAIRIEHGDGG